MHKQTHSLYKYPVGIVRQYTLIMTITPSRKRIRDASIYTSKKYRSSFYS